MIWVTWRQYRLEMVIGLALLAALTAFLVPTGVRQIAFDDPLNNIVFWFTFVPAIVGMLLAAPIVMEFEQRTYRLAWTQSVTRGRWLAVKLGFALLGTVAFSVALTALMTWWLAPQDRVLDPFVNFNFKGVVPIAYTVFALALALGVGALSRRTIPAITATMVGFIAARVLVGEELRPGFLAPAELITERDGALSAVLHNVWVIDIRPSDGVGNLVLFQPPERFWTFQAIEAAIFLGAAAMLLGLTVWVVKRRMR